MEKKRRKQRDGSWEQQPAGSLSILIQLSMWGALQAPDHGVQIEEHANVHQVGVQVVDVIGIIFFELAVI